VIDLIETNVGLESLFVIDSNIVCNRRRKRTTWPIPWQIAQSMSSEESENGMKRIGEIRYLLDHSRVIFPSQVRDEIIYCQNVLRSGIANLKATRDPNVTKAERDERIYATAKYLETLTPFTSEMYELDPREKRYLHGEAFAVRKDERYLNVLKKTEQNLINILKERKKFRAHKKNNLNDAEIFSVAYMLDNKGHRTCIISADMDMLELAKRAQDPTFMVTSNDGTTKTVYNNAHDYSMMILNPYLAQTRIT
jgi:predicted nuclease of predicted toxin-antitoxin system